MMPRLGRDAVDNNAGAGSGDPARRGGCCSGNVFGGMSKGSWESKAGMYMKVDR